MKLLMGRFAGFRFFVWAVGTPPSMLGTRRSEEQAEAEGQPQRVSCDRSGCSIVKNEFLRVSVVKLLQFFLPGNRIWEANQGKFDLTSSDL